MTFIDTHSHLYGEEFSSDIEEVILRAEQSDVKKIFLPVTEYESVAPMLNLYERYPQTFYPMVGLYPGSVKEDWQEQLTKIEPFLSDNRIKGIGEIGLDFYWDRDFEEQQKEAFKIQMNWSKSHNDMPTSIHCRKAFEEMFRCFKDLNHAEYNGVFHCFAGDFNQACKVIELGFMLGIGGVVTFKNSHLADVVKKVDLRHIVLETDAPYLAPVPYRGKRNESAYIRIIAQKIADIKQISLEEVANTTSDNVKKLLML